MEIKIPGFKAVVDSELTEEMKKEIDSMFKFLLHAPIIVMSREFCATFGKIMVRALMRDAILSKFETQFDTWWKEVVSRDKSSGSSPDVDRDKDVPDRGSGGGETRPTRDPRIPTN